MILKKEILKQAQHTIGHLASAINSSEFSLVVHEKDGLASLALVHPDLPETVILISQPTPKMEAKHVVATFIED